MIPKPIIASYLSKQFMKGRLKNLWRGTLMLVSVVSLGATARAQGNGTTFSDDDTAKYVPYRMMQGHRVAKSKFGELNIRPYTYFRYLNQLGLDDKYTDGFGKPQTVDRRQDIQLQKVSIYFTGWAFDPKF